MQQTSFTQKHFDKLKEYGLDKENLTDCICLKFKTGETILQEGLPIRYLSIVITGKAKVCSTAKNGRDLVLCYYISNGLIGDVELMTNTYIASTSIIAITDFECIAIPYQQNATPLKTNLSFLNQLGNELSNKLLLSSRNHLFTALYSGEERLCSYILQNSYDNIFSDTLTNVACSIGMSYRHMLRLLKQLCDSGVLDKKENGYLIVKREELITRAVEEM